MVDLPSSFRDIHTVVLDMDGVLTSEEAYWDAAGLVLRELLESPAYLGLSPPHYSPVSELYYQKLAKATRSEWRKYLPPELIVHCKARGINSNWDLAYLAAGLYLAPLFRESLSVLGEAFGPKGEPAQSGGGAGPGLGGLKNRLEPVWPSIEQSARAGRWNQVLRAEHFHLWGEYFRDREIVVNPAPRIELRIMDDFHPDVRGLRMLDALNGLLDGKIRALGPVFGRASALWDDCRDLFQRWYLGEGLYEELYGKPMYYKPKPGLIHGEQPLHGLEKTRSCLTRLRDAGYTLGIATGRPRMEILTPLEEWGLMEFFDPARISTHTEIENAEAELAGKGIEAKLGKPHPYVFLRSIYPDWDTERLATREGIIEDARGVLVVGDAQADIWAAQAIGCPCAALLSGAIGPSARKHLESAKPDVILNDLPELADRLAALNST